MMSFCVLGCVKESFSWRVFVIRWDVDVIFVVVFVVTFFSMDLELVAAFSSRLNFDFNNKFKSKIDCLELIVLGSKFV